VTTGRRLWAGLRLLDRQLVTNDGLMGGCVDDLELTASEDGNDLYVTAIFSGPGRLAYRIGALDLGRWLQKLHGAVDTSSRPEPSRIPFNVVADIGSHIDLGCSNDEVGTASLERWVRDHVVTHIPGAGSETQ
jgi:hypothetical protein